MRVCILGYDGLEHDLVEKMRLKHILQEEHGTVNVPIVGGIDDPSTPIVWTSFITGQPPSIHGVDMPEMWNSEADTLRSFIRRHRTLHNIAKKLKLGYRVRESLGVEPQFPSRKNIKCDTFFETVKPSIPIGVPVYNKDLHEVYPIGDVMKALQDPGYRIEFERKNRDIFEEEKRILFEKLHDDWKLLMIHVHITDLFGHVFWGTGKLSLLYEEMNLLTKQVKESLNSEDLIMIISDHGMSKLGHSKKGFYSFNKRIGLMDPDITEFYGIIEKFLEDSIQK